MALSDMVMVAFCNAIGLRGAGAAAQGRLLVSKTVSTISHDWKVACGAMGWTGTLDEVSGFVQGKYNFPHDLRAELPDWPNGKVLNGADLERVFTSVARVLIARGEVELR